METLIIKRMIKEEKAKLEMMEMPACLIEICLKNKFKEYYECSSDLENDMFVESELIKMEMEKLGFEPMHKNLISHNNINGETKTTETEEGSKAETEAKTETNTEN